LLAAHDVTTGLIFCRTRVTTRDLAQALNDHGWPAAALHGDMTQAAREDVFTAVRKGHVRLLVATDVAARGLELRPAHGPRGLHPSRGPHRARRTHRRGLVLCHAPGGGPVAPD